MDNMNRTRGAEDYSLATGLPVDQLMENLSVGGGEVLVDLGCGEGRFIQEWNGNGGRVIGLDFSTSPKDEAKLVRGSFGALPFADESVDRIISIFALGLYANNQEDLVKNLREVRRVMKKDGVVYINFYPVCAGQGANPLYTPTEEYDLCSLYNIDRTASFQVERLASLSVAGLVEINYTVSDRRQDVLTVCSHIQRLAQV